MSNSHGSTSGYPARPSPPSGSGHSSQPHQQLQQQQPSSDDGLSRRLPERRKADTVPRSQAGHPPTSSPPKQPPSSPSSSLSSPPPSSSKSPVILFATAALKDQQPCAQLAKDKSICRDYRMEDAGAPTGAVKSVHVQDRKAFARVDPIERLLMTGEEIPGTRPKRARGSSQTYMELDIAPIDHHMRVQRTNGAHRDTMRSEIHSHTQEMLTDEEECDEPKRGETIAEIHFYREETPPSLADLGLPPSEDQTSDYTSVSATVMRKHSLKGPAVVPDQLVAEQKIGESTSADSKSSEQPGGQKLSSAQDIEVMVVEDDSLMQPMDQSGESKTATVSPTSDRTTAHKNSDSQHDTGAPPTDQSKVSKDSDNLSTKSGTTKSLKEHEKSSAQSDTVEICKRTPGILPLEEEWDSTYDPNQPLEERLTATVIRRHVKSKTSTPSGPPKNHHADSKQESTVPTDPTPVDSVHPETPSAIQSPSKGKTFPRAQDKLSPKNGGGPHGEMQTTPRQSSSLKKNGDSFNGVLKSDSKTAKEPAQRITKTKLVTSPVCDSYKDLNSSGKKPVQATIGVKETMVPVPDDTAGAMERNSTKIDSAVQGSGKISKNEMSVIQYTAGSKSPSPGKRVSIRDPPETVVHDDSEVSAQRTSKSSASKTSPSSKEGETAESSRQQLAGESESESGTWVEEGRDAATKAEVNGIANPRNSKSCCFCWCCCCSCSCLSVNNNIRPSKDSKQQQQQQTGNMDHYFNGEGEPQPTLEDIRTWGESFDKLMKCGAGRKVFREFLQCEYSEENILFWLACEDLKKETNQDLIEEKARLIYEDFISILSPREVSLDSRVRDIINRNMVRPTPNTFDEAQLQIYTLMHRDSYPRFVNSPIYRKLAQLPVPSRKGSMA